MGETLIRRLDDGRTIGFSNNPMADLSDIEQRMAFVLRAAAQFDELLPGVRKIADVHKSINVGASLLAMVVNDYVCLLTKRISFKSIASKLAPTLRGYS